MIRDKREIETYDRLINREIVQIQNYMDSFYSNGQYNINIKFESDKLRHICEEITPCLNTLKAMNGSICIFNQRVENF